MDCQVMLFKWTVRSCCSNWLSGHVVQILFQKELQIPFQKITQKNKTRPINTETIAKFQLHLQDKAWKSAYNIYNINCMLHFFHCTFLNNSENSFPIVYKSNRWKNDDWITNGIRISCKYKRGLYVPSSNIDNSQVKNYSCHLKQNNKRNKQTKKSIIIIRFPLTDTETISIIRSLKLKTQQDTIKFPAGF